jgi:hypothetical protein
MEHQSSFAGKGTHSLHPLIEILNEPQSSRPASLLCLMLSCK